MKSKTFEQRASCFSLKESMSQHTDLNPRNKKRRNGTELPITFTPKWKLRDFQMNKRRKATHLFIQRVREAEIRDPPFQGKNFTHSSRKFEPLNELKNPPKNADTLRFGHLGLILRNAELTGLPKAFCLKFHQPEWTLGHPFLDT